MCGLNRINVVPAHTKGKGQKWFVCVEKYWLLHPAPPDCGDQVVVVTPTYISQQVGENVLVGDSASQYDGQHEGTEDQRSWQTKEKKAFDQKDQGSGLTQVKASLKGNEY